MTMRATFRLGLFLFLLPGCRTGTGEAGRRPLPLASQPPEVVPAGTVLETHLNKTLGIEGTEVGDRFTTTVEQPVVTPTGAVIIPRGAVVHGRVTGLDPSERLGDQAALRIDFESIACWDGRYPLFAEVIAAHLPVGADGGRGLGGYDATAEAGGAVVGEILLGDLEGILTGEILGAGAGTIISLGTRDVDATLPAGTDLILRTTRPLSMDLWSMGTPR